MTTNLFDLIRSAGPVASIPELRAAYDGCDFEGEMFALADARAVMLFGDVDPSSVRHVPDLLWDGPNVFTCCAAF